MLSGKRIIVTGATSGIGQAIALRCAQEGADVAFCGLETASSAETIRAIEAAGQRAYFRAVDLTDLAAARAFAHDAVDALGGVDGLVNNAGANRWHSVEHSTWEQLDTCLKINFYHAWAMAQACIPHMRAAGGGMIVNMSSIHARRTMPGVFPYNMTKAMLVSLTQSIAIEHGRDNIRSVAVQPGLILTPLADEYFKTFPDPTKAKRDSERVYPLGRAGRPEDIAATVAHLLSDDNRFINGVELLIDGGISTLISTPTDWLQS
jgi:NAD(P)-dependent dehydrogenase (short-subunit alcohol dehydrogenase family)